MNSIVYKFWEIKIREKENRQREENNKPSSNKKYKETMGKVLVKILRIFAGFAKNNTHFKPQNV